MTTASDGRNSALEGAELHPQFMQRQQIKTKWYHPSQLLQQLTTIEKATTLVLILGLAVGSSVVFVQLAQRRHSRMTSFLDEEARIMLDDASTTLQETVQVTRGLSVFIFAQLRGLDDMPSHNVRDLPNRMQIRSPEKFTSFAQEELARFPAISSIQTKPSNVLTQIYPPGSAPVGLDLETVSPDEVRLAKRAGGAFLSGPRRLLQGYAGLVTWWQIWLNSTTRDSGSLDDYWGSVGIVINIDVLWETLQNRSRLDRSSVSLSVSNLAIPAQNVSLGRASATGFVRVVERELYNLRLTMTVSGTEPAPRVEEIAVALAIPVIGGLFLGIAVPIIAKHRHHNTRTRGVKSAPTEGPLAIVIISIDGAFQLWTKRCDVMARSKSLFVDAVRQIVFAQGAYEMKYDADDFAVACRTADDAVTLANDLQQAMLDVEWPESILTGSVCSVTEPQLTSAGGPLFRGLRLRIGIEYCSPVIRFDQVSGGYDYLGPGVLTARFLARVAVPGQAYVTSAVMSAVSEETRKEFLFHRLGSARLPGEVAAQTGPVDLFSTLPRRLRERFQGAPGSLQLYLIEAARGWVDVDSENADDR